MNTPQLLSWPALTLLLAISNASADDNDGIDSAIRKFHGLSVPYLLCKDENWERDVSIGRTYKDYFSKDLLKIYEKTCSNIGLLLFDPRIGDSPFKYNNPNEYITEERSITFHAPFDRKISGSRASVTVKYDHNYGSYARYGNFVRYSLVKEDGAWRIDDIATGGNDMRCDALRCYDSLRDELRSMLLEIKERRRK